MPTTGGNNVKGRVNRVITASVGMALVIETEARAGSIQGGR